jgi:hypothetical protein
MSSPNVPTTIARLARGLPDPITVARIGFAAIGVFALLGIATALDSSFLDGSFRLNGEWTIATIASAIPLLAGGTAAVLVGSREPVRRRWWIGFALVLAWMSFDEVLAVHERLELATGVDWQLLYLPIAAAAALCWLNVRARLGPHGRLFMIAGAMAWMASQVLELLQWRGDTKTAEYLALMVPEELLEMTGSLLFLMAVLSRDRD